MIVYDFISRTDTQGKRISISFDNFIKELKDVVRTSETREEYNSFSKAKKHAVKDIGAYIIGELKNGNRGHDDVITRGAITLDLDNVKADEVDNLYSAIENLGVCAFLHTTRQYTKDNPRFRLIIPLKESVKGSYYEAVAKYIASEIGITFFDKTTFSPNRLMYYPSCSIDSEFIFKEYKKDFLDVRDIKDKINQHEMFIKAKVKAENESVNKQDPLSKDGIIGDFCRAYTISECISTFLSDKYKKIKDDRYLYIGSASPAGAVIYDNNKFLYSFHDTDVNSGKLLNAYDLLRVNLFNEYSEKESMLKLNEFLKSNEKILTRIKESSRLNDCSISKGWKRLLKFNESGKIKKSLYNIDLILKNDTNISDKIGFNILSSKISIIGDLPWSKLKDNKPIDWIDYDEAELSKYISSVYDLDVSDQILMKAIMLSAMKNKYNPVKKYLKSLEWDGIKRVERLFIDYLGADDNDYVKEITKLTFIACVKRAMYNDVKWDDVVVLSGKQGIGKSTILRKLGKEWFNDSVKTFEGDKATEVIQGYWICEIPELSAYRKSEINDIKHYLSKEHDIYRQPYTRHSIKVPRKQVFFGTTNNIHFLKDETGNRRFYPIDVDIKKAHKSVFKDFNDYEVDQFWAECMVYEKHTKKLVVSDEIKKEAEKEQGFHEEIDPRINTVTEYLNKKVPSFWFDLTTKEKRDFFNGNLQRKVDNLMYRDKVTASEIWEICFMSDIKDFNKNKAKEVNNILRKIDGWEEKPSIRIKNAFTRGFIKA